jgi:hypothetical protein
MRLPGFTAEASFGGKREHYVLAPTARAESGRILPQFITGSLASGLQITNCWAEGGLSGCFTIHLAPLAQLPHHAVG